MQTTPSNGTANGHTTVPIAAPQQPLDASQAATAPKARFCGKPGKSGPGKANQNAMRHGLRAGQLPKDCKYIENRLNGMRRQLEGEVLAAKGEVNLADAASIQTIMRWERHAALALRWLTKAQDTLKPLERLQFSREIAKASAERDKAIAALQLGQRKALDWGAIPEAEDEDDSDGSTISNTD